MSKNALKSIVLPSDIDCKLQKSYNNLDLTVKLDFMNNKLNINNSLTFTNLGKNLDINLTNKVIEFNLLDNEDKNSKAIIGSIRAHINNAVVGLEKPYSQRVYVNGLGYKIETNTNNNLLFYVGKTHPEIVNVPKEINFKLEKNSVTFFDINKERLMQFIASLQRLRELNDYTCYGIIQQDQKLVKKSFKKAETK